MSKISLSTSRLIFDSFKVEEAELVAKMAGDIRVVEMTASIPYPYEPQQYSVNNVKIHNVDHQNRS